LAASIPRTLATSTGASVLFSNSNFFSATLAINFTFKKLICKLVSEGPGFVRGQGAIRLKSGAYTAVCEHFESNRNAGIWQKMGLAK
jgi:hypothetical protein